MVVLEREGRVRSAAGAWHPIAADLCALGEFLALSLGHRLRGCGIEVLFPQRLVLKDSRQKRDSQQRVCVGVVHRSTPRPLQRRRDHHDGSLDYVLGVRGSVEPTLWGRPWTCAQDGTAAVLADDKA